MGDGAVQTSVMFFVCVSEAVGRRYTAPWESMRLIWCRAMQGKTGSKVVSRGSGMDGKVGVEARQRLPK
jgi:hypothetical protein